MTHPPPDHPRVLQARRDFVADLRLRLPAVVVLRGPSCSARDGLCEAFRAQYGKTREFSLALNACDEEGFCAARAERLARFLAATSRRHAPNTLFLVDDEFPTSASLAPYVETAIACGLDTVVVDVIDDSVYAYDEPVERGADFAKVDRVAAVFSLAEMPAHWRRTTCDAADRVVVDPDGAMARIALLARALTGAPVAPEHVLVDAEEVEYTTARRFAWISEDACCCLNVRGTGLSDQAALDDLERKLVARIRLASRVAEALAAGEAEENVAADLADAQARASQ